MVRGSLPKDHFKLDYNMNYLKYKSLRAWQIRIIENQLEVNNSITIVNALIKQFRIYNKGLKK